MTNLKTRIFVVIGMVVAALVLVGSVAFASPGKSGPTKPGWGFGDDNHDHTGPPGHSVHPSVHPDNDDEDENENEDEDENENENEDEDELENEDSEHESHHDSDDD